MTMDVILWRHADAEPGSPDLERALTPKGQKQARRVAEWLHGRLPGSAKILASPARRAQQTAQALSDVIHRKFRTVEALAPGASVEDVLAAIDMDSVKGTVVVVGHQPTLGQVVSRLLGTDERDWSIKKGGLVWLSQRESSSDAEHVVRAAISPDLA
jgi:phosphohistidine phosphatase